MDWISIKDKLPKPGHLVLGQDEECQYRICYYDPEGAEEYHINNISTGFENNHRIGNWVLDVGRCCKNGLFPIVVWMPLPLPPGEMNQQRS